MCGPIRSLTEARGHNTADHHLASFGGAGGQHAYAIAEALGIRRVTIHKYSSILSAYGIGLADVVREEERSCAKTFDSENISTIKNDLETLGQEVQGHWSLQTFNHVDIHRFVNMRYDGSDTAIMIAMQDGVDSKEEFVRTHHQQFGFTPSGRKVFVDTIRVRAVGRQLSTGDQAKATHTKTTILDSSAANPTPSKVKSVYFGSLGWVDTSVYMFDSLLAGVVIQGPAIVVDKTQTLLVGPHT